MPKAKKDPVQKFELTDEWKMVDGVKVWRIRYLIDVVDESDIIFVDGHLKMKEICLAHIGQLGGFVEKLSNLSHHGLCVILNDAVAFGNVQANGATILQDQSTLGGHGWLTNGIISGASRVMIMDGKVVSNVTIENNQYVISNKSCTGLIVGDPPVRLAQSCRMKLLGVRIAKTQAQPT